MLFVQAWIVKCQVGVFPVVQVPKTSVFSQVAGKLNNPVQSVSKLHS